MLMRGTPQEKSQAEAEIDNEREGPGLRSGPSKPSYQHRRNQEEAQVGANGWGGGWGDPTAEENQGTAKQPERRETALEDDRVPELIR